MSNMTTLNGNLFLSTNPSSPATPLSVSRTDAGTANPLAQISLFGEGTNSPQGAIVLQTMNSGTQDGPLQERMRVHTNGNVGIGVMDPKTALHIPASGLQIGDSSTATDNFHWTSDTLNGPRALRLYNGNYGQAPQSLLTITSDGNVGIGIGGPRRKLDVAGEIVATNRMTLAQDASTLKKTWHLDNLDGRFRIFEQPNISTPGIERLTIAENGNITLNGNVGVAGTVTANDQISLSSPVSGIHCISLARKDEDDRVHEWKLWHMDKHYQQNALELWEYKTDHTGKSCQGDAADGAICNARLVVVEGGNVGIGTRTPKARLDVNGTLIVAQGATLNGNVGIAGTVTASDQISLSSPVSGIHCISLARKDEDDRVHEWKLWHMDKHYQQNALELWEYKTDRTGKSCQGDAADGAICNARLVVVEGGNVSIGTRTPKARLDVNGNLTATQGAHLTGVIVGMNPPAGSDVAAYRWPYESIGTDGRGLNLRLISRTIQFHTNHSQYPTAYIDTSGVYHQGSSIEAKDRICPLTVDDAIRTLGALNPVEFVYKSDASQQRQLGFIAEETPTMFTSPDRKAIGFSGIVALLTAVVKEQQKTINELKADIEKLRMHAI